MQALVEKDWLAFGHPFADRVGMPAGSGNMPSELTRQYSAPNLQSSPSRQSASQAPSHSQNSNNYSPIFLQVCLFILVHNQCIKIQLTILILLSQKRTHSSYYQISIDSHKWNTIKSSIHLQVLYRLSSSSSSLWCTKIFSCDLLLLSIQLNVQFSSFCVTWQPRVSCIWAFQYFYVQSHNHLESR